MRVGKHRWVALGSSVSYTGRLKGDNEADRAVQAAASRHALHTSGHPLTFLCRSFHEGCDSVGLSVQSGLPNTPGASFLLNITWNSKAGLLLPTGDASVPSIFLGK